MHIDLKNLKYISKKILLRKTRIKIKKIKDRKEQINLYRHAIKSALEIRFHEIEMKIRLLDKQVSETFFISTRANLLKNKIKYFIATYHKKEFVSVFHDMKKLEKELKI